MVGSVDIVRFISLGVIKKRTVHLSKAGYHWASSIREYKGSVKAMVVLAY